jgi:hypothetical protein
MWKTSLAILLIILGVTWWRYGEQSQTYWQNVGPSWDKMLNPNKYTEQHNEGQ